MLYLKSGIQGRAKAGIRLAPYMLWEKMNYGTTENNQD